MSDQEPFRETKESYRQGKKAAYERAYLEEEKKWIKLGADSVLYYELKALIQMAICPLYVLSNENQSFVLHKPDYAFSEGIPQVFSLLYQRPLLGAEQVVWVKTNSLRSLDDLLEQFVKPSSQVQMLVRSFLNGIRTRNAIPERYWPIIHAFTEAEPAGGHIAMSRLMQDCLDRMERQRAAGSEWMFSCVNELVPFGLAFSVTYDSGPGTHLASVTSLGLSRSEFITVLDSVRPLRLEDEELFRRTEEGLNQAERRIYEEVAQHFG